MRDDSGDTVSLAGLGWTRTNTVSAVAPTAEATILASPAPRAVTRPVLFTSAAAGLVLYQETEAPGIAVPLASKTCALSSVVLPTAVNVLVSGLASTREGFCVTTTMTLSTC
jgi:hypothetical protein